jgi:hypothetical protein
MAPVSRATRIPSGARVGVADYRTALKSEAQAENGC